MFTHLNRSVYLSGVLSPPIIVNSSDPIKTLSYSVQMQQEINLDPLFLQGGPGKSIGDFKGKNIGGNMSFLVRINESNALETCITDLINAGQNYNTFVTLTTLLLPYNPKITAQNLSFNGFASSFIFDTCLVKSITIIAKEDEEVKINVEILGQTDTTASNYINLPADEVSIYRALTWYDCAFSRAGSAMENVKHFELTIEKQLDQRYFLFPTSPIGITTLNYDRPYSTGVQAVGVKFKFVETITSLFDVFTYAFGGYSWAENLAGSFGPISFSIPNVLFKVSHQDLPSGLIERTTEGFYQMNPLTPTTNNFLLTP